MNFSTLFRLLLFFTVEEKTQQMAVKEKNEKEGAVIYK